MKNPLLTTGLFALLTHTTAAQGPSDSNPSEPKNAVATPQGACRFVPGTSLPPAVIGTTENRSISELTRAQAFRRTTAGVRVPGNWRYIALGAAGGSSNRPTGLDARQAARAETAPSTQTRDESRGNACRIASKVLSPNQPPQTPDIQQPASMPAEPNELTTESPRVNAGYCRVGNPHQASLEKMTDPERLLRYRERLKIDDPAERYRGSNYSVYVVHKDGRLEFKNFTTSSAPLKSHMMLSVVTPDIVGILQVEDSGMLEAFDVIRPQVAKTSLDQPSLQVVTPTPEQRAVDWPGVSPKAACAYLIAEIEDDEDAFDEALKLVWEGKDRPIEHYHCLYVITTDGKAVRLESRSLENPYDKHELLAAWRLHGGLVVQIAPDLFPHVYRVVKFHPNMSKDPFPHEDKIRTVISPGPSMSLDRLDQNPNSVRNYIIAEISPDDDRAKKLLAAVKATYGEPNSNWSPFTMCAFAGRSVGVVALRKDVNRPFTKYDLLYQLRMPAVHGGIVAVLTPGPWVRFYELRKSTQIVSDPNELRELREGAQAKADQAGMMMAICEAAEPCRPAPGSK
jgi:hypothetical protein